MRIMFLNEKKGKINAAIQSINAAFRSNNAAFQSKMCLWIQ